MAGLVPIVTRKKFFERHLGPAKANLFIHLHTDDLPIDPNAVILASFAEPTWAGYAALSPVWDDPVSDANNDVFLLGSQVSFVRNAQGMAELVKGWFAVSNANGGVNELVAAYWFANPMSVAGPADVVKVTPKLWAISPV